MTTIAEERSKLALIGRRLRSREAAGFVFPDYDVSRTVNEPASRVFVHITITNPSSYSSDDAHARAVERIGIQRFPHTGVSYNRLIMQSGMAYEAQPIGRRGAHTVNDKKLSVCTTTDCISRGGPLTAPDWNLNYNSRAYAICQNVNDAVTDAELDSVARCIAGDMLAGFVRRDALIHGHRCVAWKDCPGAKMWALMSKLKTLVAHYVSVGFGVIDPDDMRLRNSEGQLSMSYKAILFSLDHEVTDTYKKWRDAMWGTLIHLGLAVKPPSWTQPYFRQAYIGATYKLNASAYRYSFDYLVDRAGYWPPDQVDWPPNAWNYDTNTRA